MGLISCFKCILRTIRNISIVLLAIALLPGIPPKTHFELESFSVTKPKPLTGPLSPNNYLDGAELLYENRILGPESLVKRGNEIYATTALEVVKLSGQHITHLIKFGLPCDPIDEEKCGRPLGLAFDTISNGLIVADAYYGIWSVNLDTFRKVNLLSAETIYGGIVPRKAKTFNAVAVAKNGDIFWTDSTSEYNRMNLLMSLVANPSGRLFHYNRATKVNKILLDNIYFANGVALSPNEDFVLVAECGGLKITRFYLKGPKAGKSDVFVDGLPGPPDNLNSDADGLWVALSMVSSDENPALWVSATKTPLFRKLLLRLHYLAELPFQTIENFYPNYYTKAILKYIGSFESVVPMFPGGTAVVRIDWNGNILGWLQGSKISAVADVLESDGYLYLGSYKNRFLGKVKLPKEFQKFSAKKISDQQEPVKQTTQKPTTTTTTTTTPKPTTTQKPTTTTTTPRPTTTTTPKPATTTTPRPTTTTTTTTPKQTTTTPKPTTAMPRTTTTSRPSSTPDTKTTQPPKPKVEIPTTTTTQKPTVAPTEKQKSSVPIHESRPNDIPPPSPEKLKVIRRGGEQGEL